MRALFECIMRLRGLLRSWEACEVSRYVVLAVGLDVSRSCLSDGDTPLQMIMSLMNILALTTDCLVTLSAHSHLDIS